MKGRGRVHRCASGRRTPASRPALPAAHPVDRAGHNAATVVGGTSTNGTGPRATGGSSVTMTLPDEDHMVLVAEDDLASRTATRHVPAAGGIPGGRGRRRARHAARGQSRQLRPGGPRPRAPGTRRRGGARTAAPRQRAAGHRPHRPLRGVRARPRPEPGGRRLRREAVLAARARRPHPGRAAPRPADADRRTRSSTTGS